MSIELNRSAFEAFAQRNEFGTYRTDQKGDGYDSSHTQLMWMAWCAAIQQAESGACKSFTELRERHREGVDAEIAAMAAEAKTGEPIYQICKADSVSVHSSWVDVDKQAYDDAGLYPEYRRRMLYTHPAPGVPDDVARDAERYRWLKAYYHNSEDIGICKWVDQGWSGQWVLEHDPDIYIDAAMLAAQAQKGD
jgi:hypothetical protein